MRFETQARIPFCVVGDRLVDFYTGEPLELGDGTVGDVVVDRECVGSTTAKLLSREEKRTIAPKGTRVLIYLSKAEYDRERLVVHYHPKLHRSIGSPFHAQAVLEADLAILLRGTKKARLVDCKVSVHGLEGAFDSLNHAYTAASERFEPRRASHSGNVFERCLIEREGVFLLLDDVRNTESAAFEARTYLAINDVAKAREWLRAQMGLGPQTLDALLADFSRLTKGLAPSDPGDLLLRLLESECVLIADGQWALQGSDRTEGVQGVLSL